jgi:hypothetical protein
VGATEAGSSGSGLFTESDGEYLLRGALRGGSASCGNTGNLADPSNRDYYSRMDTALAALRPWLSGAPTPIEDFTGMWYDASEPGWGLSVMQSATGSAIVTLFFYDDAGHPTWLVVPEISWESAVRAVGEAYRTSGTPLGAAYDAKRFSMVKVGSLQLEFGRGSAVLTVGADGRTTIRTLTRLAF